MNKSIPTVGGTLENIAPRACAVWQLIEGSHWAECSRDVIINDPVTPCYAVYLWDLLLLLQSKGTLQKPCQDCVCIGEKLLGYNSYFRVRPPHWARELKYLVYCWNWMRDLSQACLLGGLFMIKTAYIRVLRHISDLFWRPPSCNQLKWQPIWLLLSQLSLDQIKVSHSINVMRL